MKIHNSKSIKSLGNKHKSLLSKKELKRINAFTDKHLLKSININYNSYGFTHKGNYYKIIGKKSHYPLTLIWIAKKVINPDGSYYYFKFKKPIIIRTGYSITYNPKRDYTPNFIKAQGFKYSPLNNKDLLLNEISFNYTHNSIIDFKDVGKELRESQEKNKESFKSPFKKESSIK